MNYKEKLESIGLIVSCNQNGAYKGGMEYLEHPLPIYINAFWIYPENNKYVVGFTTKASFEYFEELSSAVDCVMDHYCEREIT